MQSKILEINKNILEKKVTIREVVDSYLKTISENESKINSLLEVYSESFISEQIKNAEELFTLGKDTKMTGVPIIIKDNLCVKGQITSAGSKILESYVATYNSTVVQKLIDAGAILIGRANMDEFAMGGSTENSAYKKTMNPLDISRVPGGSSGGSAAVVAYDGVPVAIGTDTGGSIRQPASFCGVSGLKPTYGDVSRFGLIAMGSSLDVVGPMAKSIEDVEIVYNIINGKDVHDATTLSEEEKNSIRNKNLKSNSEKNIENKKVIGIPRSFIDADGVDKDVRDNFYATIEKLKAKGYETKDIEIKNIEKALSVYYILMFAEVSSNLARFDGVRYGKSIAGATPNENMIMSRSAGFGVEPIRRSLLGTYVLSSGYYDAYYYKALQARTQLKKEFEKVFKDVDFVATPTSPILAWKFGEKSDPISMYLADIFTVPANIVGVPGISVPSGKTKEGLSYGIQILGSWYQDCELLSIGKAIEML
jgi:aspartyl-tRNA(Asn)/glutamyl-tRNA(Gln) amidotransferase subunit A